MNIDTKIYDAWIDYMERFEPMSSILYYIHRERLNKKTSKEDAIVRTANIDKIAEVSRND